MTTYTIEYTETEEMAMQYAALNPNEWIQNMAHERARVAIEEIVRIAVQKYLDAGLSIPGSREEIVAAAFANGWVKTVAEINSQVTSMSMGSAE
jgi:predicted transcriptional regulator